MPEARIGEQNAVAPLLLDLLEWLAPQPRPYAEVMEAWRTSCPRLPVWEEAVDRGLVSRRSAGAAQPSVAITAAGRRWLAARGRHAVDGAAAGCSPAWTMF